MDGGGGWPGLRFSGSIVADAWKTVDYM